MGGQTPNCYFNGYDGPVSDNWESTICVLIFHAKIPPNNNDPIDLGLQSSDLWGGGKMKVFIFSIIKSLFLVLLCSCGYQLVEQLWDLLFHDKIIEN